MFAINTGNLSIFLVPLCSLKFYLMYLDDLDQQPLLLGERTYISVEFLEATKLVEDGFSENFPKCEETWDLFEFHCHPAARQSSLRARMKEHQDAAKQICCCSHPEQGRFSSKVFCNTSQKCSREHHCCDNSRGASPA